MNSEDNQLFQLLDRELFKKAAQFVASLQKRYPSATYYKILEQYVKFRQSPKKYSFESGLKVLLDARSPPNDLKSLSLCHKFLLELGFDTTKALSPYEKAMMKYGSSEICYEWFVDSLKDLNWRHLSMSTFQMPRVNEKSQSRMFQFWNSLATVVWFQLDQGTISEKELDLLPKLTYKLTRDLKPFQNEQELIVFCKVCELFQDKSQEIVNEILGFWEHGTYLDLYLKNFLMDHLVKLEDYKLIWTHGISLLNNLDDYGILQNVIEAGYKSGRSFDEVLEVVNGKSTRNYMLARVAAAKLYDEKLDYYLFQFIEKYHDKPSCPVDLESLELDTAKLEEMFSRLPSGLVHDKAVAQLFHKGDSLEQFIKHKESLSTKPKTDYSDCSYFILEVVKDLCQDSKVTLRNVVTSISLLEGYQLEDPFNYDTRIWLVLLYMYLGLPEKAVAHLEPLNIKNVQNDLVNHWLFTRFSTTLPNKNYKYCQKIIQPQAIYSSLNHLGGFLVAAFERRSWCKVPGIIEFYERMTRSFTRWDTMAESLQMSRLLNEKKLNQYQPLLNSLETFGEVNFHNETWSDNRDFKIFDKDDVSCFQKIMAPMNTNDTWLRISTTRELIFYSLSKNEHNRYVDDTIRCIDDKTISRQQLAASMSRHELWTWDIVKLMYTSLGTETVDYRTLQTLIEQCPAPATSTWELNHAYLITLATLKSIDQMKRIKDQPVKQLIKTKLKETRDSCVALYTAYANTVQDSGTGCKDLLQTVAYPDVASEIAAEIHQMSKAIRNI
ncbi:unnamed protein product [Kluyveromyces dobzhanskii CBS 2104]|uniref:WGS project CCBQ000000000 data, contig 00008 n=1 Tax=Kluyveromyces dobzhanskii CBS 2104 TaxID=1427455 RepID=A0A0A8L9K7_9SACH|nr:unnamed protein product [Kluyveromyces dobzhanskii CBS 2104]